MTGHVDVGDTRYTAMLCLTERAPVDIRLVVLNSAGVLVLPVRCAGVLAPDGVGNQAWMPDAHRVPGG